MKDLSIIGVGYMGEDGNFIYEYKHKVNWTNLEVSNELYQSDIPRTIFNEDGSIKERYYINLSTKQLIYNELKTYLQNKYFQIKNEKEYKREKDNLTELKKLKLYYDKYIDVNKIIKSIGYKKLVNNESIPDSSIILTTYKAIAYDINLKINQIEMKSNKLRSKKLIELGYESKKVTLAELKSETFKNITQLLKRDYEEQKKNFKIKVDELKSKIKEYDNLLKDNSQYKNELQILIRNYQKKNLRNFRDKAKDFLSENDVNVNDKH